jgi:hypothetical protein
MRLTVSEAYENIEKTITRGFLTTGMTFRGHSFVLKNITDKEYENIGLYRKDGDVLTDIIYHLAFCTAFIDRKNFLEDRFERIPELAKFYAGTPVAFINKIREGINRINTIYLDSLKFLEGFCYTDRSRYIWKFFDGRDKDAYFGISGLNNIGLNSVQENWIIVNKRLDEEEAYTRDLNLTLIVASSMNPKGTKVISRNYDFHKKELDELRKDIATFGYDKKRVKEQQAKAEWTAPIKSREDLVRELYRQMEGKKDKHDLFIDDWIKKQQMAADEAKRMAEVRQQEFRRKLNQLDMSQQEESRPISAQELQKVLDSRRNGSTNAPADKYMSAFEDHDQRDRFLKKVSATIIRPGKKD